MAPRRRREKELKEHPPTKAPSNHGSRARLLRRRNSVFLFRMPKTLRRALEIGKVLSAPANGKLIEQPIPVIPLVRLVAEGQDQGLPVRKSHAKRCFRLAG